MKYIHQKWKTDCSVACFAMMFDISWWEAMRLLFPVKRFIPFSSYVWDRYEFNNAAKKLGYKVEYTFHIGPEFPIYSLEDDTMVVIGNEEMCHALMWDSAEARFFDPEIGNNFSDEYIRANLQWIASKVKL